MPEQVPGQPSTPDTSAPQEIKLTPADLARSWLGHRGAEVQRKIASTKSSLQFNRTYEPKTPGPTPSYVEPGSMDATDWQNTQLEYDQWPQERDESIELEEDRLEQLNNEMGTISRQ